LARAHDGVFRIAIVSRRSLFSRYMQVASPGSNIKRTGAIRENPGFLSIVLTKRNQLNLK
jgi:hypothetical protein